MVPRFFEMLDKTSFGLGRFASTSLRPLAQFSPSVFIQVVAGRRRGRLTPTLGAHAAKALRDDWQRGTGKPSQKPQSR
jgi:hypothetical protein